MNGLSPSPFPKERGAKTLIIVLCFIFALATNLKAQEDETYTDEDTASVITNKNYKANPGWYLRYIDSTQIPTGILIDRIKFKNDMGLFNGKSRVKTCDYAVFQRVIRQLNKAANDSVVFPNLDSVYEFAYHKMRWEKVYPIAIMNYKYSKIKKKYIKKGFVEVSDTALLLNNLGDSIFDTKRSILASPFNIRAHGDKISFAFYKNMYFTNDTNFEVEKIEANFGNGWKVFNWDEPQVVSFGNKTNYIEVKVRISSSDKFKAKDKKLISHFTILRSGSDLVPEPSDINTSKKKSASIGWSSMIYFPDNKKTYGGCVKWEYDQVGSVCEESYWNYSNCDIEATFWFNPNNTSGKLRKPLILCDGFDPGDKRDYNMTYIANLDETLKYSRDTRGIFEILNGDPSPWYNDATTFPQYASSSAQLVSTLQTSGYDIVIINFLKGDGDIPTNAYWYRRFLKEVINSSTYRDNQTEENVIIGPSMGGLITRIALDSAEILGEDHFVREWISFDSPNQGANIPMVLQFAIRYMYERTKEHDNPKQHDLLANLNKLNSPAARQMVLGHYLATAPNEPHESGWPCLSLTGYSHDVKFTGLYDDVLNIIGYPRLTRNIAISNGGTGNLYEIPANGYKTSISFVKTTVIVDPYLVFPLEVYAWVLDPSLSSTGQEFYGHCSDLNDKNDYTINSQSVINYDNAPGGWHSALYDINQESSNEVYVNISDEVTRCATFMVTSSAFGVPVTQDNLYYKWTDYLNNPSLRAQVPFDDIYGQPGLNEEHVRISASTGTKVMAFLGVEDLTDIQRPRITNRNSLSQIVTGPLKLKGTTSVTLGGSSSFTYTLNPGADVTIAAGTKIVFKPGAKALKGAKLKAKTGSTAMQKSAVITNTNNPVSYTLESPYIGKVTSYEDDVENATEVKTVICPEKAVNIFPNPSNGILQISIKGFNFHNGSISVTNAIGNQVYNTQLNSAQQLLNLQTLPDGLYFITLNIDGNTYREKVLLSK